MSSPFIGEVRMFGGNFAPRGWAFCDGQLLPISSNTALFSLLGTTYGGDGRVTFALPDLRSRSPVHENPGAPGVSVLRLGESGGAEQLALTPNELPAHVHAIAPLCNNRGGDHSSPANNNIAARPDLEVGDFGSTANATMVSVTSEPSGGSQPVDLRQPYLGVHFIIALVGIFPSRN